MNMKPNLLLLPEREREIEGEMEREMMLSLIQLEHKGTNINIFDMTRKQSQSWRFSID